MPKASRSRSSNDPFGLNDPTVTVDEFMEAIEHIRKHKAAEDAPIVEKVSKRLNVEPPETTPNRSPVKRFLDAIPPGLYMTSQEVADHLGVSSSLIRKIARDPALHAPSKSVVSGKFKAYLWTDEDVEEIREYLRSRSAKMVETHKEPRPDDQKGQG